VAPDGRIDLEGANTGGHVCDFVFGVFGSNRVEERGKGQLTLKLKVLRRTKAKTNTVLTENINPSCSAAPTSWP